MRGCSPSACGSAQILWLKWPGDIISPLPSKCKNKADMEAFGYVRKSQAEHIQRRLDQRSEMIFQNKYYGVLKETKFGNEYGSAMPKTAALNLPAPKGVDLEWSAGEGRPKTAPAAAAAS
eukprot:Transcript_26641.p1 GENE.Transcript_26641~~Transcript_26641.p1  ORF type:complete len:120 (-),score=21.42 Transcript_26641:145-504(-)